MSYRLRITKSAEKEIDRLPGHVRQRVRRVVGALAMEPRPATAKELRDLPGRYRIRLDKWRIIYRVNDDEQSVLLLTVRPKTWPETYQDIE